MLNFQKLIKQISRVGDDSLVAGRSREAILDAACEAYCQAALKPELMLAKIVKNKDITFWSHSLPLEPFGATYRVGPYPEEYIVVAADGSQIMPSRHEVHNCYLVNIGSVVISYGDDSYSQLESEPYLFHAANDLYPLVGKRRIIVDEQYVSFERYLLELETLCAKAVNLASAKRPVVALLDGSLIPWTLDKMPEAYQEKFLKQMASCLEGLKEAAVPLAGYISQSRASDMLNDLRLWICPYSSANCQSLCGELNEEEFPCAKIFPLADRTLLSGRLPLYQRSACFQSSQSFAQKLTASQRICFSYVNLQSEIARLEMPFWVQKDKKLLELVFQVLVSQAEKGLGYPISLAEAHYQAVIRGDDRARFFEALRDHLIQSGVKNVEVSPKEKSKRQGIV